MELGSLRLMPGSLFIATLLFLSFLCVVHTEEAGNGNGSGNGNGNGNGNERAKTETQKGNGIAESAEPPEPAMPDPVKILESFHNIMQQSESTTNGYKSKCERYNGICCSRILHEKAQNRPPLQQDDLCRDRQYDECKCADAIAAPDTAVDPVS